MTKIKARKKVYGAWRGFTGMLCGATLTPAKNPKRFC